MIILNNSLKWYLDQKGFNLGKLQFIYLMGNEFLVFNGREGMD